MLNNTELHTVLQDHLHWNRARIGFIVAFVLALMKVTTVNLTKVANALSGTAHKQSNYRRIQRFFSGKTLDRKTMPAVKIIMEVDERTGKAYRDATMVARKTAERVADLHPDALVMSDDFDEEDPEINAMFYGDA